MPELNVIPSRLPFAKSLVFDRRTEIAASYGNFCHRSFQGSPLFTWNFSRGRPGDLGDGERLGDARCPACNRPPRREAQRRCQPDAASVPEHFKDYTVS